MLSEYDIKLSDVVAPLLHAEKHREAAKLIVDACEIKGVTIDDDNPARYQPVLQNWLHHLLNNDGHYYAAQMLWTSDQFNPEPQCSRQVWDLFDKATFGLIMGAASMCLSPDERCRMEDGSTREAGDIRVGDKLAGLNGAREVLSVTSGEDEMYEVTPEYGAPSFRCNGNHILTLICSWTRRNHGGCGGVSSGYRPGRIVDVPLRDYLLWSDMRKRAYRLFTDTAEMPSQPVEVDPYCYGVWLGDGTRMRAEITSPDGPMVRRWIEYWESLGFRVKCAMKAGCGRWYVTSDEKLKSRGFGNGPEPLWPNAWFREGRKAREVRPDKRIRVEYLKNSEGVRLDVLAGLIDSDGCSRGSGFDIATKWPGLADDIEALARSLGFLVTRSVRKHSSGTGFCGDYVHLYIFGDCSRIPTREKEAGRVSSRGIVSGFSTMSFSVRPVGVGRYSGFELDGDHRFLLESGIVTHNSKSFTMGVRLTLEFIRDPEWTNVSVVGPSEDHLQRNLFSHLVNLHDKASLPLPGKVGELFIGANRRSQTGSIKGVVIPVGKTKRAGRLQGTKRYPRKHPHPVFGTLSRFFVFIDEFENVPPSIWSDIGNVMSQVSKNQRDSFKIFGAYNPSNMADEVAKRAEPAFGWSHFDLDKHFEWVSPRGWNVLRLDGERCENVLKGEEIYPGLQTQEGLGAIARDSGGRDTPGYYTMGRGAYPPMGTKVTVFPPGMLGACRGEFIWYEKPTPVSASDLALQGGAAAIYTLGAFGIASGYKEPPSLEYPSGREVMFKDPRGLVKPRAALQVIGQFTLPKGETRAMTDSNKNMNRKCGVQPGRFGCDRTGAGAGVADLMKNEWGPIFDVNYSNSPTLTKICEEDTKNCKEEYHRIDSELWFAARKWCEFKYVLFAPSMDLSKLHSQVGNRMYRQQAGKTRVESKKDYISRGNGSPDEADSFTLLVHTVRQAFQIVLSMKDAGSMPGADDWYNSPYPEGYHIDESNRTETLEIGGIL